MSTTRWPCDFAFIITPPVEIASSSGCAWTRSRVAIYFSNASASCWIPPWPGPGMVRSATARQQPLDRFGRGDDHELGGGLAHRLIEIIDYVNLHPGVLSVPARLGSVALDDEQVVAVPLHV